MSEIEPVPTDLLLAATFVLRGRPIQDTSDASLVLTELSNKYPADQVSNGLVRLQGLMAIISEADSPWVTTFKEEAVKVVDNAMFHAAARARLWGEGDNWTFDMRDFERIALTECRPMGTA